LKQITLRGIPEEIGKAIKKEAEEKGMSLNKVLISLLEKGTGTTGKEKKKKVSYHDLDHLFGIWTKGEAKSFEKILEFQRSIDEDLWKRTD